MIYNQFVISHCRVNVESDFVTMLPKFGYAHVGRTALLTAGGNLLVNLSALDTSWSSEVPSINFHKKLAYKMAFTVL